MAGEKSLGVAVLGTKLDLNGLRSGFQQARQDTTRGVEQMGRQLQGLGTRMTVALTAPITAFGAAVIGAAGGFEQSMNRVRALSGATGADLMKLQNQARELGATTAFSASQAADGMSFLAMAGLNVNEIYGAMPSTLSLAASAQLDLATAADIVTNVMTGYQMTTDQLENSVDVLTTAFISANTDLEQLGHAMSFAGPVASGLGVAFEEASAAIGMLSNAGIQGGRAGTTLSRILAILSTEGQKLGVTIYDAAGQMLPLADILEQIEARGMTSAEVMDFFGQRGGPGMLALLSQGSGALRQFTADLTDVGGTAERVAATQMEGFRGAVVELKSALEGLMISFGFDGGLLGVAESGVNTLTNVVRWIDGWSESSKQLALMIGGVVAAAGPLLIGLGTLARLMPVIVQGWGMLRVAFLPFLGVTGILYGVAAGINAIRTRIMELPDAISAASDALAKGDNASLVGALDAVINKIDGPTRGVLEALRADLIQTGDVTVEQAQRMAMALAQARLEDVSRGWFGTGFLAGATATPLQGAISAAGALSGNFELRDQLIDALNNNDLIGSIDLLNDALVSATEGGLAPRDQRILMDMLADLRGSTAPRPVPGTTTGAASVYGEAGGGGGTYTGAGGGTTAAAEAVVVATVDSVFADLASAGLRSLNITNRLVASGVDEEEARTADLQNRLRLVQAARDELLTNHYDQVTDAELAYLTQREQELLAELDRSQSVIEQARERWARAMQADMSGYTGPSYGPGVTGNAAAAAAIARDTLDAMLGSGQRYSLAEANQAVEMLTRHVPTSQAQIREWLETLTGSLEDAEAAFNEFPVLLTPPGGWQPTGAAIARGIIEGARERAAEMDFGSPFTGQGGGVSAGAMRADAELILRDTVQALVDAGAPAEQINEALEALTARVPMTTAEINELTGGLHRATTALTPFADAIKAFDEFPTLDRSAVTPLPGAGLTPEQRAAGDRWGLRARQTGALMGRDGDGGLAEASRMLQEQQRSADAFAETVVESGFQFADGLIDAIRSGSVADAFSAAISAGQSIVGGMNLGSIPFLGGNIGIGSLISGGLGLVGSIIGLFSGRGRDSAEQERARAGQVRSAPSISLHITQNNTLALQSLTDPASRTAVRRFTDEQLARIVEAVERNILPRLDKLDGGAAA